MSTTALSPATAINAVRSPLQGLPACIAGSSVAAETYGLPLTRDSDVDVFAYTMETMIAAVQQLLDAGFELLERHERVWHRWLRYGASNWHTHSIKLESTTGGFEVNLVHKKLGKQPLSTLSQVLESFDFGLLGSGYDLERNVKQDLRTFLFPGYDIDGPLPLMPQRRDAWRGGFISQYQGLRELGRYVKYAVRGYDMSLVRDDLIEGYMAAASYLRQRSDPEKQTLSQIYFTAADKLQLHDLQDLQSVGDAMVELDSLDIIMDNLEALA